MDLMTTLHISGKATNNLSRPSPKWSYHSRGRNDTVIEGTGVIQKLQETEGREPWELQCWRIMKRELKVKTKFKFQSSYLGMFWAAAADTHLQPRGRLFLNKKLPRLCNYS